MDFTEVFESVMEEHRFSLYEEAGSSSFRIRDTIYPQVEKVLSTPEGNKAFREAVRKYIDKNSSKLTTQGPVYKISFGDREKSEFFRIFQLTTKDISGEMTTITKGISTDSNWQLVRGNPIFVLFYCAIRYYTLKKDETGINTALTIYALAAYPSMMDKYFKYGANPAVMAYTIEHMTNKFIVKTEKTMLATLQSSILTSYKSLLNEFTTMSDAQVIKWIQRIRTAQNSLLKNIASQFQINYKNKKAIYSASETYADDGELITDQDNDTTIIERISNRAMMGLLTGGLDLGRVEAAAKICGASTVDLRSFLTRLLVAKNINELREFLESILHMYIFEEHHTETEINSAQFLIWASEVYRKTNIGNQNIEKIKNCLEKWSENIGIYAKFRGGTRNTYKRGIYLYLILMIQRNNR